MTVTMLLANTVSAAERLSEGKLSAPSPLPSRGERALSA
jgi:hypothetical protein